MWVFGGGQYGQLGLGDDTSNRSLPEELQQRVHAFGGYDVLQVASGDFHCICLAVSRDLGGAPVVMTWGFGAFGRLGQGRDKLGICTTPHKVEGLSVNVGGALRAGDGGASAPESAAQSRERVSLRATYVRMERNDQGARVEVLTRSASTGGTSPAQRAAGRRRGRGS